MNQLRRASHLLWALALVGCGDSAPLVEINVVPDPSFPIPGLARLELIVRQCDSQLLAVRESIDPMGSGSPQLAAPIEPGTSFYVWLQGWVACPEGTPCVPERTANAGDCTCVGGDGPSAQIFSGEACSAWIMAGEAGKTETLTLSPIDWTRPQTRLCPPADLPEGQCTIAAE